MFSASPLSDALSTSAPPRAVAVPGVDVGGDLLQVQHQPRLELGERGELFAERRGGRLRGAVASRWRRRCD